MVPERWSGSWQDCVSLARAAEDAELDFMLPIGRWKGYGGQTDYQGCTLETVTWATGILAATKRLTVFGTVHAPLIHPVIAAKEFVTADHIGEGRFGLNIVCGWNQDEFEMFGIAQRAHEDRYAYAQEWIDVVYRIWGAEEEFDFDGKYLNLKNVRAKPKPYAGTRPVVMNAGASGTGAEFAFRNCDAFFTTTERDDVEKSASVISHAKAAAARHGRDIDVYTIGAVCCRPTRREAEEYYRYCMVENADWDAVDRILALRGMTRETTTAEEFERARLKSASGLGQVLLIGSPDDIASWLALGSSAGLSGIGISFVNFLAELPYFCSEVIPRLERLGLRGKQAA
jgi:alkanesulfonate monooxygenase SsuD/methylene tetrahydromethanopterin reductase-like flavin-dependent oxidoreductase (luciferase family)